jgi:tRNA-modifying protein YgfZ
LLGWNVNLDVLEVELVIMSTSLSGVVLYDACHWGRIEVTDADRLAFLHNQSTNMLNLRQPGEGCDTVFVTSTARTIDLATAYILDDRVLLSVAPGVVLNLIKVLDRYIFFADKVQLADRSADSAQFELIGADASAIVAKFGVDLAGKPYGTHQAGMIADCPVRIAVGHRLGEDGYTVIVDSGNGEAVKSAILESNIATLSEFEWETLRIQRGRPMPGHELADEFNPLEAGLWHTISFNKGCYIGQETIARLDTYNGVKQQLWGFEMGQSVAIGSAVEVDGVKVGQVTSVCAIDDRYIGLAYVKTKAGGAGLAVTIDEQTTILLDLPYLTRERALT